MYKGVMTESARLVLYLFLPQLAPQGTPSMFAGFCEILKRVCSLSDESSNAQAVIHVFIYMHITYSSLGTYSHLGYHLNGADICPS